MPNPQCPISKIVGMIGAVIGVNTNVNGGRRSDNSVIGVGRDKNGLLQADNADEGKGNDAFHFL